MARTIYRGGTPTKIEHGEAFALMKYRSPDGAVEWFWNSRDGVTPFSIGGLQHADWGEDVFVPNFVPPVGMRIFVSWADASENVKADLREKWAQRIKAIEEATGAAAPSGVSEIEPFDLNPSSPCIATVDEALRAEFERRAIQFPYSPSPGEPARG